MDQTFIERTAIDHGRTLNVKGVRDFAWETLVKELYSASLIRKPTADKLIELIETTKEGS